MTSQPTADTLDRIAQHTQPGDRPTALAMLNQARLGHPLDDIQVQHLLAIGYRAGTAAARPRIAEEIARAIEVADGRRCPDCRGLAASTKWRGFTQHCRCGAGHTWEVRGRSTRDAATLAREHAAGEKP